MFLDWNDGKDAAMEEKLFTDAEVTAACGLHIDNLRRLITWGAIKPAQAGGGRGRVRLWTFRQSMRVAVTSEFVDAGFSLQMAHTLTYCLPLDDMLAVYNPAFIERHVDLNDPKEAHIKALVSREADDYWPVEGMVGNVILLDRRAVYADVLGDDPYLFGIIDQDKNIFYPAHDPAKFLSGLISSRTPAAKIERGIAQIARESLLIRPEHSSDRRALKQRVSKMLAEFPSSIAEPDEYVTRSCLKIHLNVGLTIAFRKLLNLPVDYPEREVIDG